MQSTVVQVFIDSLYFLALINPVSKVAVLAVLTSEGRNRELDAVATKSSLVAAGILLGSMVAGDFLLASVFHVKLHALQLAGGAVLFWTGFNALRRGIFFEQEAQRRFDDMAVVPLACPMIAGPATITACIAMNAKFGFWGPAISLLIAVAINHLIMRASRGIGALLGRFNVLGALIRLTGLIVMATGTQMGLDGIAAWLLARGRP